MCIFVCSLCFDKSLKKYIRNLGESRMGRDKRVRGTERWRQRERERERERESEQKEREDKEKNHRSHIASTAKVKVDVKKLTQVFRRTSSCPC